MTPICRLGDGCTCGQPRVGSACVNVSVEIDGEAALGWRLDLLPNWVRHHLAPYNAEYRAKCLVELRAALDRAQPPAEPEAALLVGRSLGGAFGGTLI